MCIKLSCDMLWQNIQIKTSLLLILVQWSVEQRYFGKITWRDSCFQQSLELCVAMFGHEPCSTDPNYPFIRHKLPDERFVQLSIHYATKHPFFYSIDLGFEKSCRHLLLELSFAGKVHGTSALQKFLTGLWAGHLQGSKLVGQKFNNIVIDNFVLCFV